MAELPKDNICGKIGLFLCEEANNMRKSIVAIYGFSLLSIVILIGSFTLIPSCGGGGGGGGGGNSGIPYTGLTTQASLTATNANKIFAVIWYEGASSTTVSPKPSRSKAGTLEYSNNNKVMPYISKIGKRLLQDAVGYKSRPQTVNSAVPVNETYYGSISGTLTITGSIDNVTLTGSLTMTYVNYNDGDGTYDGGVSVRIDELTNTTTDMTMSFSLLTIKTASYDMSMSGSIRLQESTLTISDTFTINVVNLDNTSKETSRFENYVLTMTYSSITNPTSGSETYNGRVYVEKYGYVDVSTTSSCIYTNPQAVPDCGGPIILRGAGNTIAAVTPISTNYVKIDVDNNGDALFESRNYYEWSNLAGTAVEFAPIANAGPDQAVATGSIVTLNGSGSADPLGNPLSYAWTMTGAPDGSAAVLSSPTSSVTTFNADLPGTYTITLSVNNGKTSSTPDTIVVTATSVDLNNGLAAYYSFSGNANDASGYGNNGVVTGATLTTDRLGQGNSAYNFDGVDDTILINASSSLNVGLSDGLTIAVWIKTHELSVEQQVVEWGEYGALGIHFSINTLWAGGPGSLYANLWNNMNEVRYIWTGPNILTANTYQHIAVTYDKTTGVASLYLNGVPMTTQNMGIFTPNTSGNLHVGARISQPYQILSFVGDMDDLRIYNRVLSQVELILLCK
jgi:hypothetical protein